jgi:hypothetical protein
MVLLHQLRLKVVQLPAAVVVHLVHPPVELAGTNKINIIRIFVFVFVFVIVVIVVVVIVVVVFVMVANGVVVA